MSAGLQITGWPAHDSPISSLLFGSDETSIFSLGSDGKVPALIGSFSYKQQAFLHYLFHLLYILCGLH